MKFEKRTSLKTIVSLAAVTAIAKWNKPLINAVMIPAHAQTSMCTEGQVLGVWLFIEVDLIRTFRLDQNGVATLIDTDVTGTWTISGNTLSVESAPLSFDFSGEFVGRDCDRVTGANGPFEVEGRKLE